MAELPRYPTDAAMCRLLAEGPFPSAAIAGRLAMPPRTVRHRLYQLRRAGIVVTGPDRLHRLAAPDMWDLAALDGDLAATGDGPLAAPVAAAPTAIEPDGKETDRGTHVGTGLPGGYWTAMVVLAATGIGLAAVVIRRRPPDPPPPPVLDPGDWGPWTGW